MLIRCEAHCLFPKNVACFALIIVAVALAPFQPFPSSGTWQWKNHHKLPWPWFSKLLPLWTAQHMTVWNTKELIILDGIHTEQGDRGFPILEASQLPSMSLGPWTLQIGAFESCLPACLPVVRLCMFVCLWICVCVCLCLYDYLSAVPIYLYNYLLSLLSLSLYLSVRPSVCLSVCTHLFLSLSLSLPPSLPVQVCVSVRTSVCVCVRVCVCARALSICLLVSLLDGPACLAFGASLCACVSHFSKTLLLRIAGKHGKTLPNRNIFRSFATNDAPAQNARAYLTIMVTPSHTASARNEKYRKQTHKWPCSLLPWLESKLPKGYLLPPAPCHKFSDVAREMWHWLSPNLQLIANPNACQFRDTTLYVMILVCDDHITSYNYIGWREISRIERLMILVEHGGTLPNAIAEPPPGMELAGKLKSSKLGVQMVGCWYGIRKPHPSTIFR